MRGRYFRYLFENLDGCLFHTGSVYDREQKKTTNYIYMVGSYYRNARQKGTLDSYMEEPLPEFIDILVLGGYSLKDVNKLINIIKKHRIRTMILPYLAPIQRLVLMEDVKDGGISGEETAKFLKAPYLFLKNAGIQHIYFLYGNGAALEREPEELEQGIHFDLVDRETLRLIRDMEGYTVPVVRAGYIVENNWLFYFGIFGLDIHIFSDFTREYFSYMDNISEMSENIYEDYESQTKRLLQKYLKKFGSSPATTVTMFEGPLYAFANENDSFMTEKEFERPGYCSTCRGYQEDGSCSIQCLRDKDYDTIQRHKIKKSSEPRFGMLMLGNANLNRYCSEIVMRFWKMRFRIRGIGVPNCGSGEDWNHQILELSIVKDRIYWVCGKHDITSVGVVSDIVLSSPNNRFLMVDNKHGCCISGYIIPIDPAEWP